MKLKQRGVTLIVATIYFIFSLTTQINADDIVTELNYRPRNNADFDQTVISFLTKGPKKIVGGDVAAVGAYPWQVSLEVSWINSPADAHFCGGAIYNSRWILTAAHCTENLSADQIVVVAGTNRLSAGVHRIRVAKMIEYPKYNHLIKHDSDVALLLLGEPLEQGAMARAIPAATAQDELTLAPERSDLIVTGWGYTTEGGDVVRDLRELHVPVVPPKSCKDPLSYGPDRISENMICAGRAEGGMDACQGDSGGPLVSAGGTAKQIGIVSWGDGCARPGRYGVYTRVSKFKTWIDSCVAGSCQN